MMNAPIRIIEASDQLGEGVLWDAEAQALWWTDIERCLLHRYDWVSSTHARFATPERLCSFALSDQPDQILAAFESGLARFFPRTGEVHWLVRPLRAGAGLRFNDGRCDRSGRFWVASMNEHAPSARDGKLYSYDAVNGLQAHAGDLAIGNGIAFSPDGRRCHWADSAAGTIHCADYDSATLKFQGVRVWASTPLGLSPDGATVDASGCLWSAQWGGGCVHCYAADGTLLRAIKVPVQQPTCVAFGGPAMDLMFVTSARVGLDAVELGRQPQAGHVFVYQMDVCGIADARYPLGAR
jgi:L-arabinonolactonase